MNPQATAGRIVHYYEDEQEVKAQRPTAAIVNRDTTPGGLASLTVFTRKGPAPRHTIAYSESPRSGCWSWMPYQRAKAETADKNQSESAEPRPE